MKLSENKSNRNYVAPETGSALWNRNYVIVILIACIASFFNHFMGSAFSLWWIDMGRSNATYGTLHSVYSLVAMLTRPITGWIIDHGNRKKAFIVSSLVYAGSLVLMLVSPIFGLFVGMRLIQGIGTGVSYTVSNTSVYDYIPRDKMEKGVGYLALANSLVSALTTSASVSTYNDFGPSAIVGVCIAAVAIGILLSMTVVFRTPSDNRKFSFKEVFDITQLFEKSALGPAIIAALSVHLGFGIRTYIILYGRTLGFANPGLFSSVSAIGLIFVRFVLDRIPVKKNTHKKMIITCYLIFIVYWIVLANCRTLPVYLGAALLWSVIYGVLTPLFQSMAVKNAPVERRGAASSTFICAMDIGIILGSLFGGFIADKFSYPVMFLFSIIPVVLAFIYYLLVVSKKGEQ